MTKDTITTIRVSDKSRNYLLRLKKNKGYDSIRTTIEKMIELIKYHKLENEI